MLYYAICNRLLKKKASDVGAAYSPVCVPLMLRSLITPESIASPLPFSPAGCSSVYGSDDGSSVVSSVWGAVCVKIQTEVGVTKTD